MALDDQAQICFGRPREVSPPAATQPLAFVDAETLRWDPPELSGSLTFNVYRGDVADLAAGDLGTCVASGLTQSEHVDPVAPGTGEAWFYLVAGHNPFGEGSLGCCRPCDAPRTGHLSCD